MNNGHMRKGKWQAKGHVFELLITSHGGRLQSASVLVGDGRTSSHGRGGSAYIMSE